MMMALVDTAVRNNKDTYYCPSATSFFLSFNPILTLPVSTMENSIGHRNLARA